MNREEWLQEAILKLKPIFTGKGIEWSSGLKIRVSCGFPSRKALSVTQKRIGECHPILASGDQTTEIFIHPCVSDSTDVLEILVHEIVHALDDCASGHKGFFRKTAMLVGLEGKMTNANAGAELTERLNDVARRLKEYPHAELNSYVKTKKQGTRLLKATCPGCGYVIRVTKQWVDASGLPMCKACEKDFVLAGDEKNENKNGMEVRE